MPVFSGGPYINFQQFAGTYKCLIMQGILQNLVTNSSNAGWTNLPMNNGLTAEQPYWGVSQGPGNVGTVTITTGSPGIINWTGHGFLGGEIVMFQTDTTLPSGLAANTLYYVVYISSSTFNVATTYGGTGVAISTTGSGTQYCYSQYLLLATATQPTVTNPAVVRIQDNCGSCVNITIQSYLGMQTNNGSNQGLGAGRYYGAGLLPVTSPNYQITASKYQFYISQVGATAVARAFALAGMLYVPPFMTNVTDQAFVMADTWDSETGSVPYSLHNWIQTGLNWTSNFQGIWNASWFDFADNNGGQSYSGYPNTVYLYSQYMTSTGMDSKWANDDYFTSDVLLSYGLNASSEGKIRGQFYDMIYIADTFTLDATDTFGGHTWVNMTAPTYDAQVPRGGVWIATS